MIRLRNKATGEIVAVDYISVTRSGFDAVDKDGNIIAKDIQTLPLCYSSVRELTSEFEDYEPKEPLIKDEKIRKAVRAWAEIHELESVFYFAYTTHTELAYLKGKDTGVVIDIVALPELEDGEIYTTTELCGEEKE